MEVYFYYVTGRVRLLSDANRCPDCLHLFTCMLAPAASQLEDGCCSCKHHIYTQGMTKGERAVLVVSVPFNQESKIMSKIYSYVLTEPVSHIPCLPTSQTARKIVKVMFEAFPVLQSLGLEKGIKHDEPTYQSAILYS